MFEFLDYLGQYIVGEMQQAAGPNALDAVSAELLADSLAAVMSREYLENHAFAVGDNIFAAAFEAAGLSIDELRKYLPKIGNVSGCHVCDESKHVPIIPTDPNKSCVDWANPFSESTSPYATFWGCQEEPADNDTYSFLPAVLLVAYEYIWDKLYNPSQHRPSQAFLLSAAKYLPVILLLSYTQATPHLFFYVASKIVTEANRSFLPENNTNWRTVVEGIGLVVGSVTAFARLDLKNIMVTCGNSLASVVIANAVAYCSGRITGYFRGKPENHRDLGLSS